MHRAIRSFRFRSITFEIRIILYGVWYNNPNKTNKKRPQSYNRQGRDIHVRSIYTINDVLYFEFPLNYKTFLFAWPKKAKLLLLRSMYE